MNGPVHDRKVISNETRPGERISQIKRNHVSNPNGSDIDGENRAPVQCVPAMSKLVVDSAAKPVAVFPIQ